MKLNIKDKLSSNNGLFIGVAHDDFYAHKWLLDQLKNTGQLVKYFFVETNHSFVEEWSRIVDAKVSPNLDETSLAKELFYLSNNNYLLFTFLYVKYILKLKVIGVDFVAQEDRAFLESADTSADPSVLEEAKKMRIKSNEIMQTNINNQLTNESGKYVILCGSIHYPVAQLLNIPDIIVSSEQFLTDTQNNNILSMQTVFSRYKMERNIHILGKQTQDSDTLLYNKSGFFSPSNFSTKEMPYGCYSDVFCTPGDPFVDIGKKLSFSL